MKKYRTEAEDIKLGIQMAEYEFEPFEARILFYLSQGENPQISATIELRDGLDRHWLGISHSLPICYGIGKYEAIQRLKYWVKKRHPSIKIIKSDYSEIRNYFPTYIKERNHYWDYNGPRYSWIGTWLPL